MAEKDDITKDSYSRQMEATIANQQQQLDLLTQQMTPNRNTNLTAENANIIQVGGGSAPVVDGGISGRDYYSATPLSFVAPNIEGRQRAAASSLRDYQTVEYFKDNFDSLISNIKNIPGVNDEVYNNLVNNAYGAINELADKNDLENYTRYVKELATNIGGDWGGNALNQSHADYTDKRAGISKMTENFDATKTGGYSPDMAAYANSMLNNSFKGVTINKDTGKAEYSSFQMPNLIEYQNVSKQVEDLVSGWKADGTLDVNKDGSFNWIRDVPGSIGMISKEGVSESDIRNYALKYLESAGLGEYMEQQATINTTNTLNKIALSEANGIDRETVLSAMVNNFATNYNNPLENTGFLINQIKQFNKEGKSYTELLLGNNALALKELMRSKFEDDTIGLPASKHSYSKDTYNSYADEQAKLDLQFRNEQRLQAAGLGKYAESSSGSSGSGNNTTDGGFSEGAETFAVSIHRDGFMFNDAYSISNLNLFKGQADENYTNAYNNLIDLKRQSAQGGKGISMENIEKAEQSLKVADDEVRYYKEVMNNVTANTMKALTDKGFDTDKEYDKYGNYFKIFNISKPKFKELVTELTGIISQGNYSKLYSTEDFSNLLDKYGITNIATNKTDSKTRNIIDNRDRAIRAIANDINNGVKKMGDSDKKLLLNPQIDATYLISEGSNAKNTALKSFESGMTITDKLLRSSPNSFKALNSKGEPTDFLQAASTYLGVPLEEVHDIIDWENTTMNPLVNKDFIISKKINNNGAQYLATISLNKNSPKYKKYESKLEDVRKNGNLKMVITPDAVNAATSNRELNMRWGVLFKDLASRGISEHSADVIKTVGLGWANTNNYSKDFNKYTFYDLSPEKGDLREVDVNGSKYGVRAVYQDGISKGVVDKDFTLSRKDPNKPDSNFYNQVLVKENATGAIKWVGVKEFNDAIDWKIVKENQTKKGFKPYSQYSKVIANTPDDLLGMLATADLYEGMYREQISASNNKKAKGGSIRQASSYNMNPSYRRIAGIIRTVESSNNYASIGDIATGGYQFVNGIHKANIKEKYGMSMEQFRNSPETQDKYFESEAIRYDTFLKGSKGIRLLNIIKTVNPSATYDDALGVVHFWGTGNVDKLLSSKYNVDTKIPYTKNGVTRYNPTLRYHIQKLKKAY